MTRHFHFTVEMMHHFHVISTVYLGCILGVFSILLHKEVEGWLFPAVNFNLVGRPQPSDTFSTMRGCLYGALASLGLDHAPVLI